MKPLGKAINLGAPSKLLRFDLIEDVLSKLRCSQLLTTVNDLASKDLKRIYSAFTLECLRDLVAVFGEGIRDVVLDLVGRLGWINTSSRMEMEGFPQAYGSVVSGLTRATGPGQTHPVIRKGLEGVLKTRGSSEGRWFGHEVCRSFSIWSRT